MNSKRKIEIFSAGCVICEETIELVNQIACPSCEVSVEDLKDARVMKRARDLGIRSVPAVVVNGRLADCCPDEDLTNRNYVQRVWVNPFIRNKFVVKKTAFKGNAVFIYTTINRVTLSH